MCLFLKRDSALICRNDLGIISMLLNVLDQIFELHQIDLLLTVYVFLCVYRKVSWL